MERRFSLIFHNESLAEVLKKIERYYNVVQVFDPVEISKVTVSGKLDLKSDINETFRIISITAPIVYEKEENVIKISVKPKKINAMKEKIKKTGKYWSYFPVEFKLKRFTKNIF